MATQLKQTDFTPQAAPRPNIRVVFSAGPAALAMREKLADVPAADSTLDELTLQSMTRNLLRMARDHLSPDMHDAFLSWGEASIRFNTRLDSDDELDAQSRRHDDALFALNGVKAQTIGDMCLKSYVAAVEAHDRGGVFGPIDVANRVGWPFGGANLAAGFVDDVLALSPFTWRLNEIAAKAWEMSNFGSAWTKEVGLPMADLFAEAATPAAVSLYEWDKALAEYQSATTAFQNCPEEPADEFDRVVSASADATVRLMTTPAPTLAEFRFKMAVFAAVRADELGEDGEVVGAIAADVRWLLPKPIADEHGAWAEATGEWQAVRQALTAKGMSDEQLEVLVERETQAFANLADLPLRSIGDAMTKLSAMIRVFGHVPPEPLTALLADLALLSAAPSQGDDSTIFDAFSARRREFGDSLDRDIPREEEAGYFARLDAAERAVGGNSATTIEGVIAKLRIAFMHQNGSAWADRAILDPSHPEFVAGLAEADLYTRMKWSAIEDLARIGGVNLSAQGK